MPTEMRWSVLEAGNSTEKDLSTVSWKEFHKIAPLTLNMWFLVNMTSAYEPWVTTSSGSPENLSDQAMISAR